MLYSGTLWLVETNFKLSSSASFSATGRKENSCFHCPFGLPKCPQMISLLLPSSSSLIVGKLCSILKSSLTLPFATGQFKSDRKITVLSLIDDILRYLIAIKYDTDIRILILMIRIIPMLILPLIDSNYALWP